MSSGCFMPQINLGVQGGIQGDSHRCGTYKMFGKKKLSLEETVNLLQNIPSESRDALIDDSSDEEVQQIMCWNF
ncbi:hypothetical protein TNCV_3026031 [Trichonephila clavipes]|nr:hypothetical protein TNCV_3026031 [Trichonephila clavipes]